MHQGCLYSQQCKGLMALTVVRWAEKVPLNLNRIMPAKGACNSVFMFFRNPSAFWWKLKYQLSVSVHGSAMGLPVSYN